MTKGATYPQIRDKFVGDRINLVVHWTEGQPPSHYCGETWCTGECGLPALVIPTPNDWGCELKARSSMTAHGPMMQPWAPRTWTGEKAEVPAEHREALLKAYWR